MNSISSEIHDMRHVLYSRGRLLEDADQIDAIVELSSITRRTVEEVERRLLSGERKRIKSSDSLTKLFRLEKKLKASGLDVYIEVEED
jgi:hypothetical protein